ncbi:MAG TPA: rRNA maturation RNase YbeY [Thermoanaerobaculia bacterium]|nr:rRNA maturation RNase YbeY [Thermoanaerobaculia bacterium]
MIVDVSGPAVPRLSRAAISAFVAQVLRAARGRFAEVSIAFVSDAAMRRLNRQYRGKNKTTDVLTFPGERPDIVISLDQARRQALAEKHSLATEVRYLILHGVLHALGYDHETDDGEMNALEMQVRGRVGLR